MEALRRSESGNGASSSAPKALLAQKPLPASPSGENVLSDDDDGTQSQSSVTSQKRMSASGFRYAFV